MSGRHARRRAALGQNFLASARPAFALAQAADVRAGELVYDLGAGTGVISDVLVRLGARVVAVERDPNLARKLRTRFEGRPVEVIEADLAEVALRAPYKVVANPPFGHTAALLRRLLVDGPAPEVAALALQREAAGKYAGAGRVTAVSLMARPWIEASIAGRFERRDFIPAPSVEVALLRLAPLRPADLPPELAEPWRAFVRQSLARPQPDAWRALRGWISNLQWRRLSAELGIAPDIARADLAYEHWLAIFRFILAHAPPAKRQRLLEPGVGDGPKPTSRR